MSKSYSLALLHALLLKFKIEEADHGRIVVVGMSNGFSTLASLSTDLDLHHLFSAGGGCNGHGRDWQVSPHILSSSSCQTRLPN